MIGVVGGKMDYSIIGGVGVWREDRKEEDPGRLLGRCRNGRRYFHLKLCF
jgi:hypothetical protein